MQASTNGQTQARPLFSDLPARLEQAPARLERQARWEGVRADAQVQVDDLVPDVEIRESVWVDADLSGRRLTGFTCRDTVFERCDVSGLVLDGASLTRVSFVGCRMTNYLRIQESSLRQGEFYQASISDSALLDCDLTSADFTDCRLSNVDLHGSMLDDLRGALSLRDAAISPDQVIALAPSLLADAGIRVSVDFTNMQD